MENKKSLGLAVVLTLFFGPLGLFYATVSGGLIMCLAPFILFGILIFGAFADSTFLVASSFFLIMIFAISYWVICVIWAATAVSSHNSEVSEKEKQAELLRMINYSRPSDISLNISYDSKRISDQELQLNSDRPSLQEWRKKNPKSSINDYYRIYRES